MHLRQMLMTGANYNPSASRYRWHNQILTGPQCKLLCGACHVFYASHLFRTITLMAQSSIGNDLLTLKCYTSINHITSFTNKH